MPPVTQAGFAPDLALPPPYQAVRLHNSSHLDGAFLTTRAALREMHKALRGAGPYGS